MKSINLAFCLATFLALSFNATVPESPHPRPALPPTQKELRGIIALSKNGDSAILGGRWLVTDGKLKALALPQTLLYPAPMAFFDGRNSVIYAQGEVTAPSGGLAVLDTNTGEHRNLVSLSEQPHVPSPSPDRTRVAYVSARGRVDVVDIRSQENTEIAPAWKSTPSWSPDGKNIAFEKNTERDQGWGSSEVAIASLDSGRVTVLDKGRFPSWSPKGDVIAYTDVDGKQLRVIDPKDKHVRILKRNLAGIMGPIQGPLIWSPDETKLIFCRTHDDLGGEQHSKIYLLEIKTGNIKWLANDELVLGWR